MNPITFTQVVFVLLLFLGSPFRMEAYEHTNLAKNRPAYASNESAFNDPAKNVTDGNYHTLWGAGVRPAWIYVDLGRPQEIHQIVIHWHRSAFPESYIVQISDNFFEWETVYRTSYHDGTNRTIDLAPATARYVQIFTDHISPKTGTAIYEIEVFGPQPEPCPTPLRELSIINQPSGILNIGDLCDLKAQLEPASYCDQALIWSSSDEEVAFVDESGSVKALSKGECMIKVRTVNGERADSCRIRVGLDRIKVWELSGDYGIIQAEHAQIGRFADRNWTLAADVDGYSGNGYIIFQGPSMWPEPRADYEDISNTRKLTYYVYLPDGGTYYYSMYTYHRKFDGDNDYWRSINWDFWRKTGTNIESQWTWAGPCGWYRIEGPGPHAIEIAGRSNGMGLDRIAFYKPEVSPEPDSCIGDMSPFAWANDEEEMEVIYMSDKVSPGRVKIDGQKCKFGATSATIAWEEVSDDIRLAGYRIYINGRLHSRRKAGETTAKLEGMAPESAYSVRIDAVDWAGNAREGEEFEFSTTAYSPKYPNQWNEVKARIADTWNQSKVDSNSWQMPGSLELPLPYFSIRQGRNVLFCWDTYFTNAGLLLIDSLSQYAKNAVENQFAEIDQIGFVPNASEPWALKRSQTPFLSMMAREVYEKMLDGDKEWLQRAYDKLRKEYLFWTDTSAQAIEDHTTTVAGLQRFYHHATDEELIAFYSQLAPRFGFSEEVPDAEKIRLGEAWMAEAESGMDFTPRFENRCHQFIPVDLNANLYLYEKNFAWMVRELGLEEEPDWDAKAETRKALLTQYCWNDERGLFMDYDFVNGRFSKVAGVAAFYPLWAGLATEEQAQKTLENLPLFEYEYGPAICEKTVQEHFYQWDYPAGWPPMYYIVVKGLFDYGYVTDARRIAAKYLDIVTKNFLDPKPERYTRTQRGEKTEERREPGFVYEKYNVVDGTIYDAEYPSRSFQGWSYGVFLWSLDLYHKTTAPERLVHLLDSLAAGTENPLLRRHFETVARMTTDTTHGSTLSKQDVESAEQVLEFFKGEGSQWETYLNGPRPLMMGFKSPSDNLYSYYWLILPKNFDPDNKDYPLYLELHGSAGGRNNNPRRMLYHPLQPKLAGVTEQGYRKEGFYVYPWGRGDKGYRDQAGTDIFEVLADFDQLFSTDPKRQYLYGFSMGGGGTFRIAQQSLDRWAAIGVYSGAMRDPTLEDAKKFKDIPVWMTWGALERRLTEVNRKLKDLFLEAGVEVKWTEVEGVGHRYLSEYQKDLMDWLKQHVKK